MTVDTIIEQAGIPLLLLVICVYYAIRLIVLHDSQAIRGKNKPPVKDEEAYCKAGGKLLLFFGAATFLMAILVFVNTFRRSLTLYLSPGTCSLAERIPSVLPRLTNIVSLLILCTVPVTISPCLVT